MPRDGGGELEDETIAQFINTNYVPIKADREERPTSIPCTWPRCISLASAAVGPMSVWLTPGGNHSTEERTFQLAMEIGSTKGISTILRDLKERFDADPQGVGSLAWRIAAQVREQHRPGSRAVAIEAIDLGAQIARKMYDSPGEARGEPLLPSSFPLRLLLRQYVRTRDGAAREMALATLHKNGSRRHGRSLRGLSSLLHGLYWLVPHFEKMLYDNALLAIAY